MGATIDKTYSIYLGHQNAFFLPGFSEQCSDFERSKTSFYVARFWRQLIDSIQ